MDSCKLQWPGAVGVICVCSVVARKLYLQEKTPNSTLKTLAMKTKTSLLTIISVVAVAAATFTFSEETASAMAAAFLPWLFLLRLKRRLAQHLARKRNNSAPLKRRFLYQIVDGIGLGQTRLGVLARRFRGAIALFLATLLCAIPIQPTITSQTVEFDESNQTVSVTFYDENLDADVHIAAIPIMGIIAIIGVVEWPVLSVRPLSRMINTTAAT